MLQQGHVAFKIAPHSGRAALANLSGRNRRLFSARPLVQLVRQDGLQRLVDAARCKAGPELFTEEQAQAPSRLQRFLGWLVANGVQGIGDASSKLGVYEAEDEHLGLGMLFFEDAKQGELLLTIPLRLALTDHPGDQESNALLGEGSPWDVRLACKILRHVAKGPDSPWHDYLEVLPRSVGSAYGTWPASAVAELQLEGPSAALDSALSGSFSRLSPKVDLSAATDGATPEQMRWASSIVHSRTFGVAAKEGGVGSRLLVPLADFHNHGGDQAAFLLSGPSIATDNVRWDIRQASAQSSWRMDFTATRDVEAGEEALLCYGNQANWGFFLHYGFVPARNPHEAVELFADVDAAVEWYLHRFHKQESAAAEHVALALDAAAREEQDWPASVLDDPEMLAESRSLKLSAKGVLDRRLMAAFTALIAAQQPSTSTRIEDSKQASTSGTLEGSNTMHVTAAERIVAARILGLIYRPGATSLLTDLKLLARSVEVEEEESEQYERLFQHYSEVMGLLEEKIAPMRTLVMSGREESQSPAQRGGNFGSAELLALKWRGSQKEVLWNGLEWLLSKSFQ